MIEIGKKIQEARKRNKLSIEQLSEKTKIRPYIISALESGDFKVMPDVYVKSFLKTLKHELKIDDLEFPVEEKAKSKPKVDTVEKVIPKKEVEKVFEDESKKKKIILDNTITTSNFMDIFKKKGVKKSSNTYFFNYILYTVFAFALIAGVYITFITVNSEENTDSDRTNVNKDTTEIKDNKDNLLSFFEKPDSISLVARANDTAWMRINIDGNAYREILMKPGMEEQWKAQEYFLIDQGNVGAVRYFRNGEQLQSFGMPGSVIKNVKITIDQVLNANVWKLDTAKKNNPEAASNQQRRKRQKAEEPKKRIMLEESNFESPTPFKKQDKKPPNID